MRRRRRKITITAQKMKFSIKDFFSKCEKIHNFMRIWSHLLKKILNGKLHFLCSKQVPNRHSTILLGNNAFIDTEIRMSDNNEIRVIMIRADENESESNNM